MRIHAFARADDRDTVAFADARWLLAVACWRPTDRRGFRSDGGESLVLLLGGTFDLAAGGTAWPARGNRKDPFSGRPMAVFLPPAAELTATNGTGEILVVTARQPVSSEPDTGHAALARKPLLPLAGSGKAFDPTAGEWRPAETFPTSPESLPPRRMRQFTLGDVRVERVFDRDYKAATLGLDEAVLPAGATLDLAALPDLPRCDERLLVVRTEGEARVGDHTVRAGRDGVFTATATEALPITAVAGRCWAAIAYAGK